MLSKRVKSYMRREAQIYVDSCGDVNATELAESAAAEFDIYADENDIPDWLFDLAAEVAWENE